MKVLNFGSLNIDHVYTVDHFVRPGETLASFAYQCFAGGKGLNQSVALARAGFLVRHAGNIGPDGSMLVEYLTASGADVGLVQTIETPTGHAFIQVDAGGENAIILFGGANQRINEEDIARVLAAAGPADVLLLQNEIASMPEILRAAARRGLRVVFNTAPMSPDVLEYPLKDVALFICNETEVAALTRTDGLDAQCGAFRTLFPKASCLLTLGSRGSQFIAPDGEIKVSARMVRAVDTTAAGDTFTGYFLAKWLRNSDPKQAMEYAAQAAALCVTRPGAAESIPCRADVDAFYATD